MTESTELQRLSRLRRLARQIAASWPVGLDRENIYKCTGAPQSNGSTAAAPCAKSCLARGSYD